MDFLKGTGQGMGQGMGQGTGQGTGQDPGLASKIGSIGSELGSKISTLGSGITSGLGSGSTPNVGFDSFYTIVLSIAVVVLILVLAFLGWTMSKQKDTDNFPKLKTTCPDFWQVTQNGKCKQPSSEQVNFGSSTASNGAPGFKDGEFDFANAGWSAGGNAVCAKKKWANSHGINWDTVTNANYC
jgi:hypothetical protein